MLRALFAIRWCRWLVYLLLAGSAALMGLLVARQVGLAADMDGFVEAPGRVTLSRVGGGAKGGRFAEVVAVFRVDRVPHHANQTCGLPPETEALGTSEQVTRHPVGSAITVYYDPTDPERACLTREVPVAPYAGPLVLLLLTLVAAVLYGRRVPIER